MTWKAYAAVSGATVFAGWLASSPPANAPTSTSTTSAARSPRARQESAGQDIQEQAQRLGTRLRGDRDYPAPERNPFRFEDRGDVDPGFVERGTAFEPEREQPSAPLEVAPPPLSLSGIAEDQANDQISRTAVISSPA